MLAVPRSPSTLDRWSGSGRSAMYDPTTGVIGSPPSTGTSGLLNVEYTEELGRAYCSGCSRVND